MCLDSLSSLNVSRMLCFLNVLLGSLAADTAWSQRAENEPPGSPASLNHTVINVRPKGCGDFRRWTVGVATPPSQSSRARQSFACLCGPVERTWLFLFIYFFFFMGWNIYFGNSVFDANSAKSRVRLHPMNVYVWVTARQGLRGSTSAWIQHNVFSTFRLKKKIVNLIYWCSKFAHTIDDYYTLS